MPTYSHSRLSTFESCPLKYRYAYVDKVKLEERPETVEAFMGKRVHEALCKLYSDRMLSKYDTRDDLLEYYDGLWGKNWSDNILIVRKEYAPENYHETGRKCIADYYDRYRPFDDERTLGLEQMISIDIDGYKLIGYIDRLSCKGDGKYEIHDYKTSRGLPPQSYFDADRQLAIYQIGVGNMWKDAAQVDLVWHYLMYDREVRSIRTPEMLDSLKSEIIALIHCIEEAGKEYDFPARESELCKWCEYRSLCPSCKHIDSTGRMPHNEFMEDDGVKLVNEFVRLHDEKKELTDRIDSRMELLKEAIIAYAKREGLDVIRGSDRTLKVKAEMKPHVPGKGDEEREALELLIKSAGAWDDLSTLDTYALARALRSNKLDPALQNNIRQLVATEVSYRISLSRLSKDED
jgi:putative RecB family exonuclease